MELQVYLTDVVLPVTWVFDLLSDIRVGEVPHQKKIDLINMKLFHVNMKFGPYMKYKKHFMQT